MTQYMQEAGAMKQLTDDEVSAEWMRWNLPGNDAALAFHDLSQTVQVKRAFTDGLRRGLALAAALPPAAVQAGWKLVPTEPTKAMLDAAEHKFNIARHSLAGFNARERAYKAMLDAAPRHSAAANEGTLTAGKQGGDGVTTVAAVGVHKAMATEYQDWIDFHAAGRGSFDDFMAQRHPTYGVRVCEHCGAIEANGEAHGPRCPARGVASDAPASPEWKGFRDCNCAACELRRKHEAAVGVALPEGGQQ